MSQVNQNEDSQESFLCAMVRTVEESKVWVQSIVVGEEVKEGFKFGNSLGEIRDLLYSKGFDLRLEGQGTLCAEDLCRIQLWDDG